MPYTCFHNGILLSGTNKFDNGAILIRDNKIIDVFNEFRFSKKTFPPNTQFIDVQHSYIAPGFIDTHIHGFYGFGTDTVTSQNHDIIEMAKALTKVGVTSFCPTLYPKPKEIMEQMLSDTVKEIEYQKGLVSSERGATINGIHMEGPFISKKRLGVHKPECALMPNIETMETFIKLGKGYISNMTVAPELKGMHEIAILASNNNIVLQAGHTDAEYKNIIEGIQVGIVHSTHFFNAMSRLHHRNPGTVGAILLQTEMSCEVIADGFHVHPLLITLLLRNKAINKVVLITDAITPTALNSSPLMANGEEIVIKDNLFYTKKDDIIAGSALTMQKGIKNLISWEVPIEQAVRMATANPAEVINIPGKGKLMPKYDADLVIFDHNINIQYTVVEGHIAYCA